MDSTNPYETFNYMFGSGATEPQGLAAADVHHLQQQHHHLQPLTSKVTLEDVTGFGQTHTSADFHHQQANQLSTPTAGPTSTSISAASNLTDLQTSFNLNGLSGVATAIPQNYQNIITSSRDTSSSNSNSSNSSSGSGSNTINSNASTLSHCSNLNTSSTDNPYLSVTTPAQTVSQPLMVNGGYTQASNNNQFSSQLPSSYGSALTLPLESAQPVAGDVGYPYGSDLLSWQHQNENVLASQLHHNHHSQEQQNQQHHRQQTPHQHTLPSTTTITNTPATNVNLATAAAAAAANALALGYPSRLSESSNSQPEISTASSQASTSGPGLTEAQLRQQQIDLENRALLRSLIGSSTFPQVDDISSVDAASSQSKVVPTLNVTNQFSDVSPSNYFNLAQTTQFHGLPSQQQKQHQHQQRQQQQEQQFQQQLAEQQQLQQLLQQHQQQQQQPQQQLQQQRPQQQQQHQHHQQQQLHQQQQQQQLQHQKSQQQSKQQTFLTPSFDLFQQSVYDSKSDIGENSPSMPILIDIDSPIGNENDSTFLQQALGQVPKLQPIAKKRTFPENELDSYPAKRLKSMSTDLSDSSRAIFESKSLADQIKLRFQAVFMTYIKMGSVAELVDRFSKLLLEIDTSGDQIPDPDPFSIAFEVALENDLELFWTGMRSQSLVITRCRVWIAKLFKARHWDQATTILNALYKMSLTQSHLETFKLSRLLQIIIKKEENVAAKKAAEMLLQRAEELTELNSRPSQNGITGGPLGSASDILKTASRGKRLSPSPGPTVLKANSSKPLQPIEPITSSSRKRAKAEAANANNTTSTSSSTTTTSSLTATRKRPSTKDLNKKAPINSAMALKTKASTSAQASSSSTSSSRSFTIPRRTQSGPESKSTVTSTTTPASASASTSLASSFFKALKPHKASAPLPPKPAPASTFSLQNHLKIIRGAAKKAEVKEEVKEDSISPSSNGTNNTAMRKKRKRVHWKEDDNLVQVKEFYLDPEEAAAKRSALGIKPLDFNEAKNAFAMFRETPENMEMLEWYTPIPFADYPGCEDVAVSCGGRRPTESSEAETQKRAEEERLIAIYLNDSQIPDTPNESLLDRTQPSGDSEETKIIPLADELASHPLLNYSSSTNDDDDDYDPSAFPSQKTPPASNPDMDAIKSLLDGLKKTVGTTNGGNNKTMSNTSNWSGNQGVPTPAEAILTHLTSIMSNGPKNLTDNGTPSPEKKPSRWVNNNSTLTQKHLELRSKDVRPFVRNDQTTMDKWKFPCHFFKDHCDNGDQCTYLHLPN